MSVCMPACILVCMYVCAYLFVYGCTLRTRMCVCGGPLYIYICISVSYFQAWFVVYVCVRVCTCVCTCLCVCSSLRRRLSTRKHVHVIDTLPFGSNLLLIIRQIARCRLALADTTNFISNLTDFSCPNPVTILITAFHFDRPTRLTPNIHASPP